MIKLELCSSMEQDQRTRRLLDDSILLCSLDRDLDKNRLHGRPCFGKDLCIGEAGVVVCEQLNIHILVNVECSRCERYCVLVTSAGVFSDG